MTADAEFVPERPEDRNRKDSTTGLPSTLGSMGAKRGYYLSFAVAVLYFARLNFSRTPLSAWSFCLTGNLAAAELADWRTVLLYEIMAIAGLRIRSG
jgi:hypothetical protein